MLNLLLVDKTSGCHLLWGTDAYSALGAEYERDREMTAELLLREPFRLMRRAEKERCTQSARTKSHAEVFTPLWVVRKMNDFMEAEWFGRENPFEAQRVSFPKGKTWRQFIDSRRMEITCGEAPYLVNRYDVSSGECVPLPNRAGILDRKLRVVAENTSGEAEWLKWAFRAFQATYGYEFQGDNVLLARLNLLLTFEDYMLDKLARKPSLAEFRRIIDVITWNIWQMDGLSCTLPYGKVAEDDRQLMLFDVTDVSPQKDKKQPPCWIFDWQEMVCLEFTQLKNNVPV